MDSEKKDQNTNPPSEGSSCPVCACTNKMGLWIIVIALVIVAAGFIATKFSPDSDQKNKSEEAGTSAVNSSAMESHEGISWNSDYQAGMKLATEQKKPVLIAFTTSWCPPCQYMKKEVYTHPAVSKAAEAFVSIMIDPEKETDLATQYKITAYPTYIFLQPDGKIIETAVGSMEPEDFAAKLTGLSKK
jgi:thioredoxin 1